MTTVLFVTDLHLRATKPISRLDKNFIGTQLGKLQQVAELCVKHKVDFVVCGGDVFDEPNVPHSVVIKTVRAFSAFPCDVYSIVGNHDISGYSRTTEQSSAIGVLFAKGVLKRLEKLETKDAVFFAMHCYDAENWAVERVPGKTNVIVSHKPLTTLDIPQAQFIKVDDVAGVTNADLILSGDIHKPHHVTKYKNVAFVNPGSMTRMSVDDAERTPKVAIVRFAEGGFMVDFEKLQVPPTDESFDMEAYGNRLALEKHSKEFVRAYVHEIKSVKAEAHDVGKVLISYMAESQAPTEVRGRVVNYLERAQKAVLQENEE